MQVGPSRELFEYWAPDSRNGLIITGYSIEGTPARVSDKWFDFGGGYLAHIPFPVIKNANGIFFLLPLASMRMSYDACPLPSRNLLVCAQAHYIFYI